jgi:PII-like signaling protein
MNPPVEAELLRIYVGEGDKYQGRPLYQAVVDAARAHGLAGATVLQGTLGFGSHSHIHTAKILRISEDLPMVIEIVDQPDRIASFLPELEQMLDGGLITLEKVRILRGRRWEEDVRD